MINFFEWQKLGKVFDPEDLPGHAWMRAYAQSPSVVVDGDRVRVFFSSRPEPDARGMFVSRLAYLDLDRENPRRIVRICGESPLPLGARGTFDEFGTSPVSVIRDGSELRAYYAGWTRCESVPINGAIGVAISRDSGESFHRLGDGPIISCSPDEPFMMGSPRIRRFNERWYLWYVSGKRWIRTGDRPEPVYKMRSAESPDGLVWTKHHRDLLPNRLGPDECQACGDVFPAAGAFHMFYSFREATKYKSAARGYRMGYARSHDLYAWERLDERVGIAPSPEGWDSEMVNYPHVFELDGVVYMLYQGNGMGRTGFGLARLVSRDAWSAL
jgi:hypothetical protein